MNKQDAIDKLIEYIRKRDSEQIKKRDYRSFAEKYSNLPLIISIIVLLVSIMKPVVEKMI